MGSRQSTMAMIQVLKAAGVVSLGGPLHGEIYRVARGHHEILRGQYDLVGRFPGGTLPLPGYGGFRTIHAARRALEIFEAGGTTAEALAAALHAQHPKEEHDAI